MCLNDKETCKVTLTKFKYKKLGKCYKIMD